MTVRTMNAALNKPSVDHVQSTTPEPTLSPVVRKKRSRPEEEEGGEVARKRAAVDPELLQNRVDAALSQRTVSPALLLTLMCDLLAVGEVPAFVQVHDAAKAIGVAPDSAVRNAMEKEHRKGKPGRVRKEKPQLRLPSRKKRSMGPFRRLHKMCVGKKRGKKLARRSSLATDDVVQRVRAWIEDPSAQNKSAKALIDRKAWISKNGRRKLASAMANAIGGLGMQAALGVITKLKRKKVLK